MVNATWMNRVETVVDQVLARDMFAVLNVHHDSWIWADVSASGANLTMIEEKFTALWTQIATRFKCKSEKLIFEPINEPPGNTQTDAAELNKLNAIFLTAVNQAGGNNPKRVVSLSGLGMDSIKTSEWFVRPTVYPNQPWGLQFHYYSPCTFATPPVAFNFINSTTDDFIFSAWGKTIWGSDSDKAAIENDFALFHGNFSGIPAFIGEYDASVTNTETAARWKYFDFFIRTCNKYGYSSIVWDNGNDLFDRSVNKWRDYMVPSIITQAIRGRNNSLADSTTDPYTTTQSTSAYLFYKAGSPVVDQNVTYSLNGNTLISITNSAQKKISPSLYKMFSTGVLTLSAAYLSTIFSSSAAPGTKETLELNFSAGTALYLQVVVYDIPTVATNTYKVDPSQDLYIPIAYKGTTKPAAVRAIMADGTGLADSWTHWLGPLQSGRWTYGSWGWDANNVIIWRSGLNTIKSSGQNVTITWEFLPRDGAQLGNNAVNVTITQ